MNIGDKKDEPTLYLDDNQSKSEQVYLPNQYHPNPAKPPEAAEVYPNNKDTIVNAAKAPEDQQQ